MHKPQMGGWFSSNIDHAWCIAWCCCVYTTQYQYKVKCDSNEGLTRVLSFLVVYRGVNLNRKYIR